eukprot:3549781-Amphidinium_carterae.1
MMWSLTTRAVRLSQAMLLVNVVLSGRWHPQKALPVIGMKKVLAADAPSDAEEEVIGEELHAMQVPESGMVEE